MQIGHIEGKDRIYDGSGNLILRLGEQVLFRAAEESLDVSEGSGILNMNTLFGGTAETGELYVTDQRIALITRPDPVLAAKYDLYPYGMADAVAKFYKAVSLKRFKALEFCVIEHGEIEGFWVRDGKAGVLFLKGPPDVTRKAIMYRKGKDDRKFRVLKDVLSQRLPTTEPEDSRGSFLLGARYPFVGRRRIRKMRMQK